MYGDKYNFNTFYEQEQIFDISGLSNIQQMRLTFYQNGDFKDNDNNYRGGFSDPHKLRLIYSRFGGVYRNGGCYGD